MRSRLALSRDLGLRSVPLLVLVLVVVALSAPTAHHVVHVGELRARAQSVAHELGQALALEAARRPVMWRYDSPKVVAHLQRYRPDASVARVRVLDDRGVLVARSGGDSDPSAWEHAAIGDSGSVWVGVDLGEARAASLRLLGVFFALGLLLSAFLWWLPRRALDRAEARIVALFEDLQVSRGELASLNRDLEAQVASRVAELQRANADLAEHQRRLRELTARAVSLQEAERRAIGRELHDGVGQVLTAVRLRVQMLSAPGEAVERTLDLVDRVIEEVRRAVELLGPSIVREVGLRESVRRLLDEAPFEVAFEAPELGELAPALETTAYRITQEATNNATRHSQAARLEVEMTLEDGVLELQVHDDGVGFDPSTSREGHGLRTMRERAELLGGSLEVKTTPRGTTVIAHLPVP
ncbi:MAG: sensor histidine kinase [Sandaracinus sp.]|nr:sensor histidine kinase [Sandaracinus sp.]